MISFMPPPDQSRSGCLVFCINREYSQKVGRLEEDGDDHLVEQTEADYCADWGGGCLENLLLKFLGVNNYCVTLIDN